MPLSAKQMEYLALAVCHPLAHIQKNSPQTDKTLLILLRSGNASNQNPKYAK